MTRTTPVALTLRDTLALFALCATLAVAPATSLTSCGDDDDTAANDDDATSNDDDATSDDDDATAGDDDDMTGDDDVTDDDDMTDDDDVTDDDDMTDDDDATDDDDMTGDDDDDTGPTVTAVGAVTNPFDEPVANAEICVTNLDNYDCTTTAEDGTFVLFNLPANTELDVTVEAKDYISLYYPILTDENDFDFNPPIVPTNLISGFAKLLGTEYDRRAAHALIIVSNVTTGAQIADATFSLSPAPGGTGPFYLGDGNVPDKDLTATSDAGAGGYVNINASEDYILTVSHPTLTCGLRNYLRPGPAAGTYKMPARDGFFTVMSTECEGELADDDDDTTDDDDATGDDDDTDTASDTGAP